MRSRLPCPSFFQQRNTRFPSLRPPRQGSGIVVLRLMSPRLRAIAAIASLNGDGGGYRAWITRFSSGLAGSLFKARHSAEEIPPTKWLGSKVGAEYNARTSPRGVIAT